MTDDHVRTESLAIDDVHLSSDNSTLVVSGTSTAGTLIQVNIPQSDEILATAADDQGRWSVTTSNITLDNRSGVISAYTIDAANQQGLSTEYSFLDTVRSSTPTFEIADSRSASDEGAIATHRLPTLKGTGEVGDTVEITMPETGEVLKTVVNDSGEWSIAPERPLTEGMTGDVMMVMQGKGIPYEAQLTIKIEPDEFSALPIISGTAIPDESVTVMMPVTNEILTTQANDLGYWSVHTAEALADGDAGSIMISSMDASGHESTSVELPLSIKSASPVGLECHLERIEGNATTGNVISIKIPEKDLAFSTQINKNGEWKAYHHADALQMVDQPAILSVGQHSDGEWINQTPEVVGTGKVGQMIQVTMPATGEVMMTKVHGDGMWSVQPKHPVPFDTRGSVSAIAIDGLGNVSRPNLETVRIEPDPAVLTDDAIENADDSSNGIPELAAKSFTIIEPEPETLSDSQLTSTNHVEPLPEPETIIEAESQVANHTQPAEGIDIDRLLMLFGESEAASDGVSAHYTEVDFSKEVLDLSEIMVAENHSAAALAEFIHVHVKGDEVTLEITADAEGDVSQMVKVQGADITQGGALVSDQDIIQTLLDEKQIVIG